MIADADNVTFETRSEIDDIIKALDAYKKDHPKDKNESADRLADLLDAMYISW